MEKAAGMRLESERGRGAPERLRALERGSNDGAVPAMHAIEIADGDDRAPQGRVGSPFAANDDKRLWRLELVVHDETDL